MKHDLLSITELARLRKVTSETLRHYDRVGLIKPDYVDPQTRYRYYSIRQYERLGTIKELRALGLSIDEIREYFDNRNLEKSLRILKERQRLLIKEIEEKMLLSQILGRKLHFLDDVRHLPAIGAPFKCHIPKRYIITFGTPAGGPREHAFAFTKLEQYLTDVAPVLASDCIGVYCDERILHPSSGYIPCVPMLFVQPDSIERDHMVEVPANEYLCMFYRGTGLEEYNGSFELINRYLDLYNLEIDGDIFQVYKIDKTVTDDPDETLLEIQVPIRLAQGADPAVG